MRRVAPGWVLAALFIGMPIVEIYLIVQLGQVIGAGWTILVIIAAGVLGAWLVRREGARAWRALTEAIRSGRVPSRELADGALLLIGGTLLVTPGFVTDVVGLVCVLPFTRPLPRRVLTRAIARRLVVVGSSRAAWDTPHRRGGRNDDSPPDPGVVRGDVIE